MRNYFTKFINTAAKRVQGICIRGPLKRNEVTGSCPRCKYPKPDKLAAFSLVEMLMALLVVSLLLAALAPVITKKMSADDVNISGQGTQKPMNACVLVNDSNEDIEKECIVPNDVNLVSAIVVSGGAGGSGAMSSVEANEDWKLLKAVTGDDNVCDSSNQHSGKKEEVQISKNITALKIKIVGAGAGGGGGNYSVKADTTAAGCAAISGADTTGHGNYATYDSANNLCITKYNQVSNPETYTTSDLSAWNDTRCTNKYTHECDNNQKTMAYAYSGCNRPVCTHAGAQVACATLAARTGLPWRLPKYAELQKWTNSYKTFAFCTQMNTGTTFNEVAYCGTSSNRLYTGTCSVHGNAGCVPQAWPRDVWGEETLDDIDYSYRAILSEKWDYGASYSGGIHSVRCVLDKTYSYYSGGGASSGQYVEFEVPQRVVKLAASKENKLRFNMRDGSKSGGKGAAGYRPTSAYESFVGIYNGVKDLYGVVAFTGYAGAGATTSANGAAQESAASKCWFLDTTHPDYNEGKFNGPNVSCDEIPGLIAYKIGNPASGVTGGASTWPGGGNYGAGGDGGQCYPGSDGAPICGTGAGGRGSRAEVYYKHNYPGAGGSGGNAGSFLHVKNIQVNAGDKIKIQAGKAGSGGFVDSAGGGGGNSFVEFSNGKKYEVIGGKPALDGALAVPSSNTFAKSGNIQNITADDIITPETRALLKDGDEVYPKTTEEMALLKGTKAQETTDVSTQRLSGGNGGVNPKISGLAGVRGIPCGGYSSTAITINKTKYECGSNKQLSSINYSPTPLYRALTEDDLKLKVSNYINSYAPGGTGGGGGAWSNDFDDTSENTGRGQDGMGGYVILYFQ